MYVQAWQKAFDNNRNHWNVLIKRKTKTDSKNYKNDKLTWHTSALNHCFIWMKSYIIIENLTFFFVALTFDDHTNFIQFTLDTENGQRNQYQGESNRISKMNNAIIVSVYDNGILNGDSIWSFVFFFSSRSWSENGSSYALE